MPIKGSVPEGRTTMAQHFNFNVGTNRQCEISPEGTADLCRDYTRSSYVTVPSSGLISYWPLIPALNC
jgi:hypothetical protein